MSDAPLSATNGYERSEQIASLAMALSKAQSAMDGAKQSGNNPHFKSRYNDLGDCWNACRAPLTDNGLSILQPVSTLPDGVIVTTLLLHESGEFISHALSIKPVKDDAQSLGSAITYLRRYGLCALVGIAPDDDDDGEAASRNTETSRSRRTGAVDASAFKAIKPGVMLDTNSGVEHTLKPRYAMIAEIHPGDATTQPRVTLVGFDKDEPSALSSSVLPVSDDMAAKAAVFQKANIQVRPVKAGEHWALISTDVKPPDDGQNTEEGRKRDIAETMPAAPPSEPQLGPVPGEQPDRQEPHAAEMDWGR